MKTLYIFFAFLLAATVADAQTYNLPSADVKTLDGITISSDKALLPGNQTMLVLWSLSSNQCVQNLENLQELWIESLKDRGVNFVSVCVDANGYYSKVKPYVQGNAWEFDTYIDVNGEFSRTIGVNELPLTILLDNENNQIVRYEGFPARSVDLLNQMTFSDPIAYFGK
jgi:hypothetical protein